jgi:hypothetical protein
LLKLLIPPQAYIRIENVLADMHNNHEFRRVYISALYNLTSGSFYYTDKIQNQEQLSNKVLKPGYQRKRLNVSGHCHCLLGFLNILTKQ